MTEQDTDKMLSKAWELFHAGNLSGAEQMAMQVVQIAPECRDQSPLPDIILIRAFYLSRQKRFSDAKQLFSKLISIRPDDRYAQEGYLLTLHDELQHGRIERERTEKETLQPGKSRHRRLVIGIGTGRSGSTTLTELFARQDSCYSTHEHPPRLPWIPPNDTSRLDFHCRRFDLLLDEYDYVVDVSHWWLNYIDQLLNRYPQARIVALQRDRDDTVESFLNIKGGTGQGAFNHWVDHDGQYWRKSSWDECYPKFQSANISEAIGRYWDGYYGAVASLVQRYPKSIRVFATEQLGETDIQSEILSFCGIESPKYCRDMHLNKRTAHDGRDMY